MDQSQRHFVLVHGAGHGAWCWYKLVTLLKSAGHRVTALDMAASGVHPKQVDELRSMSDYSQPLMEFMEFLPPDDRVVLVGHSAGGISMSVAMERFPEKISVAAFVASFMHGPDLNLVTVFRKFFEGVESWMDTQHRYDKGQGKPPTSILWGPKHMQSKFYNLSPPEDLTLATMLVRPYPLYHHDEVGLANDTVLTKENYGSVRRVYVVVEDDYVVKEEFQRWLIENNPADEVKVISGADHMVMFSNPQELSSCLLGLAEK
ncbi:methyl jasmonate esterase 1-like isoform X3 [Rhododendron vialii]|uniref:methyl jasmonate esterase 1-like isoform X3 n=1 Tax=Rhododendron vialii TaxID=182163 RepID=UPI00265FE999|nr:methyl jasmonate esterase 1-like isoform X3 [Rhododendron vialii]